MSNTRQKYQWRNAGGSKPTSFALVDILLKDDRVVPGWWNGATWDGPRDIPGEKVISWRRIFSPSHRSIEI